MDEITYGQYWTEIDGLARDLITETYAWLDKDGIDHAEAMEAVREDIDDTGLFERIDGHQWVIYNYYHLQVLKHSANEDYAEENFGGEYLAETLKEGGLSSLHCGLAFWAMYADVQERLYEIWDEVADELEEEAAA